MNTAPSGLIAEARRVLMAEASAIEQVASRVGNEFAQAVELMAGARLVHVSGIGKSGHIARKIAGTLTSTGTPATFLHGVEAVHGDIGILGPSDAVILISRSGECQEMLVLAGALRELRRPGAWTNPSARLKGVIAITGVPSSPMAGCADVVLDCSIEREAGLYGLAPTSSTAASLAMGDALAMVLMGMKGIRPSDFRRSHPGGVLPRSSL